MTPKLGRALSYAWRVIYKHGPCFDVAHIELCTAQMYLLHADDDRWSKQGPLFDGGREAGCFDAKGVAACHVVRDLDTKK